MDAMLCFIFPFAESWETDHIVCFGFWQNVVAELFSASKFSIFNDKFKLIAGFAVASESCFLFDQFKYLFVSATQEAI